ncbi:hypothetical protein [Niveispirillum irakense]|uniref:hypothetical protein n=1 Tax=Niveispirillum irakense TaxID=34011 RepID=UPI0003F84AB9|nr:hypothetical protein [Niveispirillum irakense]
MNHRQILDLALRDLPADRAIYLSKVADALAQHAGMDERTHLTFPVLAAAAAGIEPVLEPAECADQVVRFMNQHAEGVAHTLYSAAYLHSPAKAMAPWAAKLKAAIAIAIMDQLSSGQLEFTERKVWRFRSDSRTPPGAFPYADAEEE